MKTLYYSIIVILIFFTSLYLKPIQADDTNGVEIKNIRTLPPTIIVGQTFKISATLVNNSSKPIFVDYGSCEAPFSVTFDTHVLVNETHPICNLMILEQKLNPGENTTATSPSLDLVYKAIQNGTVNATITFPHQIWNQTSQSNSNAIVSEPFSFTIYGKIHAPTLSSSDNQAIIDVALAIPGLQKWSNDWQFVSMGFMTANDQPGNWQYATVNLKASSSSSLIPCDNNNEDWSAWVMIDRTTMKVIQANYPTMESHNCNYTTSGGPASYGSTIPKMDTPLKQFKSGVALKDIKCASDLQLVIKAKSRSPACVKLDDVSKLVERGWADKPNSLQEQLDFASACMGMNDACRNRFDAQNMTKENQTASSIPQCVSNIQNQYAIAGPRGDPLCPAVNFQASGKIVKYTGFYGVYGYSEYLSTPNFVLEPGHNGTLSYEIDIGSIHNWGNEPPTNNVNITNDIEFMHDAGMNNHPGVTASVDSKSEMIQKNGSAFVTVTFAATNDAKPGTYWVDLPPSFCAGGKFIILTITNCEK